MVKDEVANNAGLPFGEGHGLPVRSDEIFEVRRLDGAEGATVLEPLTAKAVKVVVGRAHSVAGLLERERLAALATVDRPLQVVIVDTRLLTTLVTRFPDTLHFGEKRFADKCRLTAGVLDTLEPDGTRVVAVLEH
nr:hypothetical protein [Rhodococcus sp. DMU2021]